MDVRPADNLQGTASAERLAGGEKAEEEAETSRAREETGSQNGGSGSERRQCRAELRENKRQEKVVGQTEASGMKEEKRQRPSDGRGQVVEPDRAGRAMSMRARETEEIGKGSMRGCRRWRCSKRGGRTERKREMAGRKGAGRPKVVRAAAAR